MADKVLKEKRRLFVESVDRGVINGLLDDLLEVQVLNQEEMEIVREENKTVRDKARVLIDAVICKGPKASQCLTKSICERDGHLAEQLGLSSGSETGLLLAGPSVQVLLKDSSSLPVPQAIQANDIDTLKFCSNEDFQRQRKKMEGQIYPVMEKVSRTHLALIICNIEFDQLPKRNGAEYDITGMHNLLEGLGYRVDVKENLTALEMESVLKQFASYPEHWTSDSTFLVLMSHGVPGGICGKDYTEKDPQMLDVNKIFQIFNTSNCPSLKDKPKVIIIQACRGGNDGTVWVNDSAVSSEQRCSQDLHIFEDDAVRKAHVEKDFIAFCSSTPDNMSWRNIKKGSLFIIQLILCFREYAWCCHLYDIFCKVQHSFETPMEKVQMPTIERATLTKYFYLFPGN
ncbi:caspase-1-like [Gracilinanus agilis]|uniref:caspase-1-like n=1 Tax=Gracilinanus agilis TaxID=191870 RepID=UPI001CFE2A04|nr:caspase-1-like [Gracilinanus agilis]